MPLVGINCSEVQLSNSAAIAVVEVTALQLVESSLAAKKDHGKIISKRGVAQETWNSTAIVLPSSSTSST